MVRPGLTHEWSTLLAACSVQPRQEQVSRLRPLLQQSLRWKLLFDLAGRHGAQALLYQALLGLEEAIPEQERRLLKQNYETNLRRALLLSRELIRIIEHLSSADVSVMPYKGLALAEMVYHDISLRQAGDIDLLIRAEDFPRICSAVGELGYTPHLKLSQAEERAYLKVGYECAFDSAAGRNLLEVQWAVQPRFYAVDFNMGGLFERAVTVSVAGQTLKTPSPSDLLLLLSAHSAKHVWGRLVWLSDIARLMQSPDLDWPWIASQARALGIVRILWVTMLAANRLLEAPVPDAARASLPKDSTSVALAEEISDQITSDVAYDVESVSYFRLMMRLRERPSDRLRFLGRLVFTPGPSEWKTVRLPHSLFPLYRLVRLSRLAARIVRA